MYDDHTAAGRDSSGGGSPHTDTLAGKRGLRDLADAECLDLLRQHEMGRVGFTTPSGPRIYPVNYVFDDGAIVIRTSPYAGLWVNASGVLAFEIDEIDSEHCGWSVLVVGAGEQVDDPDEAIALRRALSLEPWVPGERNVYVRITPREISGRRIG